MGIFVSIVNFLRKYRINEELFFVQKLFKYLFIEVSDDDDEELRSV